MNMEEAVAEIATTSRTAARSHARSFFYDAITSKMSSVVADLTKSLGDKTRAVFGDNADSVMGHINNEICTGVLEGFLHAGANVFAAYLYDQVRPEEHQKVLDTMLQRMGEDIRRNVEGLRDLDKNKQSEQATEPLDVDADI